jgi:hypothetical protein
MGCQAPASSTLARLARNGEARERRPGWREAPLAPTIRARYPSNTGSTPGLPRDVSLSSAHSGKQFATLEHGPYLAARLLPMGNQAARHRPAARSRRRAGRAAACRSKEEPP